MSAKLSTAKRGRKPAAKQGQEALDEGALGWIFSTWPSQKGAAQRIGLTRYQFRTIERRGEIRYQDCPTTGRRVFDPISLREWKIKNPTRETLLARPNAQAYKKAIAGEASAKAFCMFDEGAELREVVKVCQLNPDQIYELREHYVQMGSDLVFSSVAVKELRQVLPLWNGKTEDGLTSAITRRVREAYEQGKADHHGTGSSRESAEASGAVTASPGDVAGVLRGEAIETDRQSSGRAEAVRLADRRRSDLGSSPDGQDAPGVGAARVAGDEGRRNGDASGIELSVRECAELEEPAS